MPYSRCDNLVKVRQFGYSRPLQIVAHCKIKVQQIPICEEDVICTLFIVLLMSNLKLESEGERERDRQLSLSLSVSLYTSTYCYSGFSSFKFDIKSECD